MIASLLLLLLSSPFLLQASHDNDVQCYDLPIVVLQPHERFPTKACKALAPVIGLNCMKQPIPGHVWTSTANEAGQHCIDIHEQHASRNTTHLTMQYRGDSSLGLSKHQFSLSFATPEPLVNLPPGKTWVLNGPFIDGSLLRNHLAHWLYRQTGRYSPRSEHVVLFIQQPSLSLVYHGLYLILEHISFEPHRLALDESGGFAWQYNPLSYGDTSPNFDMDLVQNTFGSGQRPILEYPPELTQSMRNDFVNTSTGPIPRFYQYLYYQMNETEGLEDHIELGSFVDYLLHTELSLNQDAFRRSAWFFKATDEPINAGPVWDYNLAYGLGAAANAQGWLFQKSSLWKRLRCHYKFASLVIQRWQSLRQDKLSSAVISSLPIQKILTKCHNAQWQSQEPYCASVSGSNEGSYTTQLDALVSSLENRAKWMDEHIYEFYTSLNETICGATPGGAKLPAFNCADASDDGSCLALETRDQYTVQVDFPPLRKKFPQSTEVFPLKTTGEKPNVDPCWFSVGVSVLNGAKTPFCSGFGTCPGGPDATCTCVVPSIFANCSPSLTEFWSKEANSSMSLYSHYFIERLYIVLGVGVVSLVGFWLYKMRSDNARRYSESSRPILNGPTTTYGSQ